MPITEAEFENEAELEAWSLENLDLFLGKCFQLGKTKILTQSGKAGVPDAFAFNFDTQEWFVIECELLRHGVWPHIAEQVTRFVVALQNLDSRRKLRDQLFEAVLSSETKSKVASQLGIGSDRLLQQIELLIEGVQPQLVIFIDETNQDLTDFAHALETPTSIYRVRKLMVNGVSDYYSPDHAIPLVSTTPDDKSSAGTQLLDVLEQLGGGTLMESHGRFKCFKLHDGRTIHLKRSKFHEKKDYYWYGLNPSSLEQACEHSVTHIVFVLGDWGFSVVPIQMVESFCQETSVTLHPDGQVRHYHALISPEPNPVLYWSNDSVRYDLTELSHPFASN